jgi:hypothetical protein
MGLHGVTDNLVQYRLLLSLFQRGEPGHSIVQGAEPLGDLVDDAL